MLVDFLLVGFGGFLGSILRYTVYLFVRAYSPVQFPVATLVVNTVGCFVIGALSVIIEKHHPAQATFILFISVGVLGGFTTFSAFGLETVTLFRSQQMGIAALNAFANMASGFGAVWIGRWVSMSAL